MSLEPERSLEQMKCHWNHRGDEFGTADEKPFEPQESQKMINLEPQMKFVRMSLEPQMK